MKNFFAVAVVSMLCCVQLFSQYAEIDSSKLPKTFPHYLDELTFDVPSDEQAWTKESPGLHAAFGSTDELYFRREVPSSNITKELKLTGWKGERLNAHVITWSPDTINQVRLKLNDLTSNKGHKIEAKHITANLVRYVLANILTDRRKPFAEHHPTMMDILCPTVSKHLNGLTCLEKVQDLYGLASMFHLMPMQEHIKGLLKY